MNDKHSSLIGELDMIHENLQYAKQNTDNPLINSRIEEIKKFVSKLINDIEQMEKYKEQRYKPNQIKQKSPALHKNKPKKNVKHHQAPKGRNAHRQSGLFNAQGGFKPTAFYHVKGYED
ncbi:hypothetical protein ABE41_018155 [Fictibacillus arsenicus]|uniref:Uncharacterized protein n=1 Tax=Fictibacillus arsenicus TaxID=255247 RepID=A0A1B1Z982_9BACL|nr:hypothetical protein [Fictibacillus arsenicus]ANX13939.1 hypothetical protein ABE41_018155 [Fictibacillus arsenicus]